MKHTNITDFVEDILNDYNSYMYKTPLEFSPGSYRYYSPYNVLVSSSKYDVEKINIDEVLQVLDILKISYVLKPWIF